MKSLTNRLDDVEVDGHAKSNIEGEGNGQGHWKVEAGIGLGYRHAHGGWDRNIGGTGRQDGKQEAVSRFGDKGSSHRGGDTTVDQWDEQGKYKGKPTLLDQGTQFGPAGDPHIQKEYGQETFEDIRCERGDSLCLRFAGKETDHQTPKDKQNTAIGE